MSYSSFMYCTNVERIEIPSIEQWVKVEVVEFAGQTPTYVFFKEGNCYVNGELIVDCVIPEGVTEINTSVFGYCESIKTITFLTRSRRLMVLIVVGTWKASRFPLT